MESRPGHVDLAWCASHLDEAAVEQGLILPWHFAGNYVADKLAEKTAAEISVPDHVGGAFKLCQSRACKVRLRLVAAHRVFLNDLPCSRKRSAAALEGDKKRTCRNHSHSCFEHELKIKVLESSHNIMKSSVKRWSCSFCHSWGDPRYKTIFSWLQQPCVPRPPPGFMNLMRTVFHYRGIFARDVARIGT